MVNTCCPLSFKIFDQELTCIPIGFQQNQNILIPGCTAKDDKTSLSNAWIFIKNDKAIAFNSIIDSELKCQQFHSIAAHLSHQLDASLTERIVSIQLDLPENDWNTIAMQHYLLTELNKKQGYPFEAAHLSFPIPFEKSSKPVSEFFLKAVRQLPRMQNSVGWFKLFFWFHEEIERALEGFHVSATEEYSLEARFTDFVHEVRSAILVGAEEEIADLLTSPNHSQDRQIETEKEIFRKRNLSYHGLATQYSQICEIQKTLVPLLSLHPELEHLWVKSSLLEIFSLDECSETPNFNPYWIPKYMALLALGYASKYPLFINGNHIGKSCLFFCLGITLAAFLEKFGWSRTLAIISQWVPLSKEMNMVAASKGAASFEKFLEHTDNQCCQDIHAFRTAFYDIMHNSGEKILRQLGIAGEFPFFEEEILNLLPPYAVLEKNGKKRIVKVADYNAEGKPIQKL